MDGDAKQSTGSGSYFLVHHRAESSGLDRGVVLHTYPKRHRHSILPLEPIHSDPIPNLFLLTHLRLGLTNPHPFRSNSEPPPYSSPTRTLPIPIPPGQSQFLPDSESLLLEPPVRYIRRSSLGISPQARAPQLTRYLLASSS